MKNLKRGIFSSQALAKKSVFIVKQIHLLRNVQIKTENLFGI